MAHWAELDENNVVVQVTVGDNNDPNGDEGYQWLIDNLGGRWLKCSYNTVNGVHLLGGEPLRWTFPGVGYIYLEKSDKFIEPSPFSNWVLNEDTWEAPKPKPDSGMWYWSESIQDWAECGIGEYNDEELAYFIWLSKKRQYLS